MDELDKEIGVNRDKKEKEKKNKKEKDGHQEDRRAKTFGTGFRSHMHKWWLWRWRFWNNNATHTHTQVLILTFLVSLLKIVERREHFRSANSDKKECIKGGRDKQMENSRRLFFFCFFVF